MSTSTDEAAARFDSALGLYRGGRQLEALAECGYAIAADPGSVNAHALRGEILMALGRPEDAVASYDAALALEERVGIRLRRAEALHAAGRPEAALDGFAAITNIDVVAGAARRGMGHALYALRRFEEALAAYDAALQVEPGHPLTHYNRGNTLRVLKRFEEAVTSYEAATAANANFAEAHHNRALCLLHQGKFVEGFAGYEWRRRCPSFEDPRYRLDRAWTGAEDLTGRTLYVFPELYQGDLIQFCRYALMAERRGARVILSAPLQMHRLLRSLSPTLELADEFSQPEHYDLQCGLMSLPQAFGVTLESLPGEASYLAAEPERIARWRSQIGSHGLKVGVVWQGSTLPYAIPLQRSYPLKMLEGLGRLPGVRLISLQKHGGLDQLSSLPVGMTVETLGDDFDPGPDAFVDTAAAIAACDLVVTMDTSVAHLAGALGARTWVALPYVADWRWLDERSDCPWYPNTRLFRQTSRGDWSGVFRSMEAELKAELGLT